MDYLNKNIPKYRMHQINACAEISERRLQELNHRFPIRQELELQVWESDRWNPTAGSVAQLMH